MRPHEEGGGEGACACRWLAGARRSEALTLAHRPPCQLVGHPVPRRSLRVFSLIGMHAAYTPMKPRSEHPRYLLSVYLFCFFVHMYVLRCWRPTQRAQERPKRVITATSSSHNSRMA